MTVTCGMTLIQWTCVLFTVSAFFYSMDAIVYWAEAEEMNGHLIVYPLGSFVYFAACVTWIFHEFPDMLHREPLMSNKDDDNRLPTSSAV